MEFPGGPGIATAIARVWSLAPEILHAVGMAQKIFLKDRCNKLVCKTGKNPLQAMPPRSSHSTPGYEPEH